MYDFANLSYFSTKILTVKNKKKTVKNPKKSEITFAIGGKSCQKSHEAILGLFFIIYFRIGKFQ